MENKNFLNSEFFSEKIRKMAFMLKTQSIILEEHLLSNLSSIFQNCIGKKC